jgi:hypothetical protein
MVASGRPAATPQNITPIASPSGILCSVIASAKSVVFFQLVSIHSFSSFGKLICK